MGKALNSIKEYAAIAFTLLGILFGMFLMVVLFGNLDGASGFAANSLGANISAEVLNDSLQSIATYSGQSSSQFRILAFAILFIILVGLFLLFWKIFVAGESKKGGMGGTFGN